MAVEPTNGDDSKVKVGLIDYSPYIIYSKSGDHRSLVYDLLDEIENLSLQIIPPKRALEEYKGGNIDVLFFSDRGAYEILKNTSNFLPLFQGNTHLIYR